MCRLQLTMLFLWNSRQLPTKYSRTRRCSFSGSGNPSPKVKRASSGGEKQYRRSLSVRGTSSAQIESLSKPESTRAKRHSSSPSQDIKDIVAAIRAEVDHQEEAAKEISLASREDALKKIQALREDVELASHHSPHHSTPDRSAEPSQVEICVAELTKATTANE